VGFPTVSTHDLFIHPREGDLIAGTHGRSVWILDDFSALQQLTPQVMASELHLFQQKTATKWQGISRGATRGHKLFMGRNPLTIDQQGPGNSPSELENSAAIHFWLGSDPEGTVTLEVSSLDGEMVVTEEIQAHEGINRWFWDLRFRPTAAQREEARGQMEGMRERFGGRIPAGAMGRFSARGSVAEAGTYLLKLTVNGQTVEGTLAVRDDPGVEGVLPSVR
jgi:hypothetical protein